MAERDPFGRLPDENPLEFLGQPSNGTETAAAEAEAAAQARATAAHQPAPARAPERRPRVADFVRTQATSTSTSAQIARGAGRVVKAVVGVWVLMAAFVLLVGLVLIGGSSDSGGTSSGTVQTSGEATPPAREPSRAVSPPPAGRPSTPPPPPSAHPPAPSGLNATSLLTRGNLAPALRRLATSGLGRLRLLSIRPERIDAQLLTRGGRLRSVQLLPDGKLSDFGTGGPGFGYLDTTAFARVRPAAPARLVRGAAERLHRPTSAVDYVVLLKLGSALTWSVFMRDGKHFVADASGRITRRVS
jgi:hypothetical protein